MSGPAQAASARRGHGRAATLAGVARGARLTPERLMLVALSTAIAHIGLLVNSIPVIIGAMLISPLLGPILGLGFGIAVFEGSLVRRSLVTLVAESALAIAIAAVLTWLSPIRNVTPEILARVEPSLLELLVAIFGGIAAAYATFRKTMIELVGVAIATALIPPLAVVGFALTTGRFADAGGAALLYVTNVTAIALMATATARLSGFGHALSRRQGWVQTVAIFALLVALAVPLGLRLAGITQETRARSVLTTRLQALAGKDARIDQLEVQLAPGTARVDALVIVPGYVSRLESDFAEQARLALSDRVVDAHIVQLRSGTVASEADAAERLRTALGVEARWRDAERIRAALAVAAPGAAIVVDAEARAVTITFDDLEPQAGNISLDSLKAAFPDWTIRQIPGPAEE